MTWAWHRLGDLLVRQPNGKVVQQGWSPRCYPQAADDGEWAVLKTTAIQDGRFEPQQNKLLPDHMAPRRRIEVHTGDLLMTCAGPRARCGVPALVRPTRPRLMMSGMMYRFRPDERVLPASLELWLRSPEAQRRIDAMKTRISDSGLNLTHDRFVDLPVPVPPIGEQLRIVGLLEDHLSRLDAADASVRAGILRASRWHGELIDDLLWREEYPRVEVRPLLREPMRNGRSDRAVSDGASGTRTLTITAVTKDAFTPENTKVTTTTVDRARGLWLEPGDVFVQRSNTPELVGTSARYGGQPGWAIFPDLLIRLRANETQMDSRFLAAALRSEKGHRQRRTKEKGAAGSMPKIDQAAIGCALVPLPPLAQQAEILAQLHEASNALARLRGELSAATRRSASLRRSLLAAAFSGRLTGDLEVAGV